MVGQSLDTVGQFIETAPDAMLVVDGDGLIVLANSRAAAMFETTSLVGMIVEDLVPPEVAGVHPGHRASFMADRTPRQMGANLDLVACRLDGSRFPVEISLGHFDVDGDPYVSVGLRDVTERRAVEMMKDEFLSTISHELRTPLTVIIGFAKLLRNQVPDQFSTHFEAIIRNSDEMHTMVERMLDFSRIQAGRIQIDLEETEIAEVVEHVLPLVETALEHHDFRTEIEEDLVVVGDRRGLTRILVNLLTNAAKFTVPGGLIELRTSRVDGRCEIVVEDRGAGIPREQLDLIFDRFYQVRDGSGSGTPKGAGLGLSIVQSYTEAMGGSVRAESEHGLGSRFVVDLPLAPSA